MNKRYQIFISSTYIDLIEERQKVIQTLMEMDCIPSGMELFPAADEEQWEFIKKVINDCDYYLLIIGGRYGSTTYEGLSYTEMEYDYAVETGKKVIALIHGNPKGIPVGKSDLDPALREKLEIFKSKVKNGRLIKFWENASELPGLVSLSLNKTIKLFPSIGWVKADKIANTEILNEINELRKEKEILESENKKLQSLLSDSPFLQQEETEFNLIWERLKGLHNVNGKMYKPNEESKHKPLTAKITARFSLIKALYFSALKPDISFRNEKILSSLKTEIFDSESFHPYIKDGYKEPKFYEGQSLYNLLMVYGLYASKLIEKDETWMTRSQTSLKRTGETVYFFY